MDSSDLVIVGGGIAGAALASAMARAGYEVHVLESTTRFVDRVRGELLTCWGVEEVRQLGLLDVLFSVPHVNVISRYAPYDETVSIDDALVGTSDLADVVEGVPGLVGVSHPGLSEALLTRCAVDGATVRRGVTKLEIHPGADPKVSFVDADGRHEMTSRLIVGADGRESSVRRHLGWSFRSTTPRVYMGGMLVDDTEGWPRDLACSGVEGDVHFLVFPQAGGLTRLYLAWSADQPHRFAGPDRQRRFLEAFRCRCIPAADVLADASPAGPCASFPMTDTWLERPPFSEGVVLIGDAAGWSDPVAGQGLSVAFRDVRVLSEILRAEPTWDPTSLAGYEVERSERMRRIRFQVAVLGLTHGFGEEARRRRRAIPQVIRNNPTFGAGISSRLLGAWKLPTEGFTQEAFDVLSSAHELVG